MRLIFESRGSLAMTPNPTVWIRHYNGLRNVLPFVSKIARFFFGAGTPSQRECQSEVWFYWYNFHRILSGKFKLCILRGVNVCAGGVVVRKLQVEESVLEAVG